MKACRSQYCSNHCNEPLKEIVEQELEAGASTVWFLRGDKQSL